jgi:hypothetical protein
MPAASVKLVPEAEVLELPKIAPRLIEIDAASGPQKHRRAG